jgi:hypothetical protein
VSSNNGGSDGTVFTGESRDNIGFQEKVGRFKTNARLKALPFELQGILELFQKKSDMVMERVNNFVMKSDVFPDYKEHTVTYQLIEFIDEPRDEKQALARKQYFPRESWRTERPYELIVWISRDVLENIASINNPEVRDLVIDAMVLEAAMHFYPGYTAFDMRFDRNTWEKSTQGQKRIATELASLTEDRELTELELAPSFLPFTSSFVKAIEERLGRPIDWPEFLANFSRRGKVEEDKPGRNIIETTAAEFFYYICYVLPTRPKTEEEFRSAFQKRFDTLYQYNFWMDMPAYEAGFKQGKTYRELVKEKAVELFYSARTIPVSKDLSPALLAPGITLIAVHTGEDGDYEHGDTDWAVKEPIMKMLETVNFTHIYEHIAFLYSSYLSKYHSGILVDNNCSPGEYFIPRVEGEHFVIIGGSYDYCHYLAFNALLQQITMALYRSAHHHPVTIDIPSFAVYCNYFTSDSGENYTRS